MDAMCAALPMPEDCGVAIDFPDSVSTVDALHHIARADHRDPDQSGRRRHAGDQVRVRVRSRPSRAWSTSGSRRRGGRRCCGCCAAAIERGEVRPGADTPLVADVLPAVLAHRVIMQRERVTEATITEIMDQVLIPLVEVR